MQELLNTCYQHDSTQINRTYHTYSTNKLVAFATEYSHCVFIYSVISLIMVNEKNKDLIHNNNNTYKDLQYIPI